LDIIKNREEKQRIIKYFDRGMLSDAIVFFTFTLFAYSRIYNINGRTVTFSGRELLIIPEWVYTLYGTLTLILALIFSVAIFNCRLANWLRDCIDKPIGFIYWVYFLAVYTFTWYESIILIDPNDFLFYIVVYIGLVFFIVIFIKSAKSIVSFIRYLIQFRIVSS
jgi:hypothetical protein